MDSFDVLIVGGGAAGLTAALVLSRARRSVAIVDAGQPRNAPASHMHGFLSRDGMPPAALLAAGRAEIAAYGATSIDGNVAAIEAGFTVRLVDGRVFTARRVLIATGLRDQIPDLPGVHERWGRDVLHCPYCHGWEVRDLPIGVLGGTPEAVAHALLITQWSSDVTLFPHTDELTDDLRELLASRRVDVVTGAVSHLDVRDDRLHGVALDDGRVFPRTAVFVKPTLLPNSTILAGLGCEMDDQGWVRCDTSGRTSVDGVYVAGNVSDPRAQVITAAGQGSASAIAINAELVDDDIAVSLAGYRAR